MCFLLPRNRATSQAVVFSLQNPKLTGAGLEKLVPSLLKARQFPRTSQVKKSVGFFHFLSAPSFSLPWLLSWCMPQLYVNPGDLVWDTAMESYPPLSILCFCEHHFVNPEYQENEIENFQRIFQRIQVSVVPRKTLPGLILFTECPGNSKTIL